MSAAHGLADGQRLTLPAGVLKSSHNASTFRPYDPSETLGETSPTNPKAPKKNKCGVFGAILLTVIAVAVTFILPVAAPGVFAAGGMLGSLGGAVAASMIGSVVSQGVGLATGLQDKFSFKQVAMAGITAAIGGGMGKLLGPAGVAGSKLLTDVVRGAASSAISQGIGVVTGLQKKFDFAGVAAAGIGAGIGGAVSRSLALKFDAKGPIGGTPDTWNTPGQFGHNFAVSMADAIGQATARSVIEGTSFGDNLLASLPSAIGNTIGSMLAQGINDRILDARAESIANSEGVPDGLRGSASAEAFAREALAAGANKQVIEEALGARQAVLVQWDGDLPRIEAIPASALLTPPTDPLLAAELNREVAALSSAERQMFDLRRSAEVLRIQTLRAQGIPVPNYDEHRAIHEYLYQRERLPGQITPDELRALGAPSRNASVWARPLSDAFARYGIISREQRAAFMGQAYVETQSLTRLDENLRYSTLARLMQIFGRHVGHNPQQYLNNPQALGNRVYANRNGNGNEASGDGYRYRGRGFLQVTGKTNYTVRGYANNPDVLADPVGGAYASAAYWHDAGLSTLTSRTLTESQYFQVSRAINNPYGTFVHGRSERWNAYLRALRVLR